MTCRWRRRPPSPRRSGTPTAPSPSTACSRWSARTYEVFAGLADVAGAGVALAHRASRSSPPAGRPVVAVGRPAPRPRRAAGGVRRRVDVPGAGRRDAGVPRWLAARVEALGGTITRLNLRRCPSGRTSSSTLPASAPGCSPRTSSVEPVRGQVVYVEQVGLEQWCLDSSADLTYVVPRSHDIVVGGTDQEGDWSRTPSPADAAAILARARRLVPALAAARVLQHRVGLRPARPSVRVERVGRRRALLRPRRRRRHPELGDGRRGGGARRVPAHVDSGLTRRTCTLSVGASRPAPTARRGDASRRRRSPS